MFSQEECDKWRLNPKINPKTNRTIKAEGPVYKKLEKECIIKLSDPNRPLTKDDCATWKSNVSKHPISKRKIKVGAKTGIYAQLVKLCATSPNPPGRPITVPKTPIVKENLENARNKLLSAIRKAVKPVLHKGDTTELRLKFTEIMNKYLKDLEPCLQKNKDQLCLVNKKKEPIIIFDKRIGSESVYGVAFLNMGKGFAKLLKFSCKIMAAGVPGHKEEIGILARMSELVEKQICPNMPLVYKSMLCTKKCAIDKCPKNISKKTYYVVINELANCDIQTWFVEKHSVPVYESVIMQMLFAMYSFHSLGLTHHDCHLGNFLIHKIKPGGCWRYQVNGKNVYVPNLGYLLVMWDPGLARKSYGDFYEDYNRAFTLIANMEDYKSYRDRGMKPLPDQLVDFGLVPLLNTIAYSSNSEVSAMDKTLDNIKRGVIKFKSIVVDDKPPTHLLNIRPYKLRA